MPFPLPANHFLPGRPDVKTTGQPLISPIKTCFNPIAPTAHSTPVIFSCFSQKPCSSPAIPLFRRRLPLRTPFALTAMMNVKPTLGYTPKYDKLQSWKDPLWEGIRHWETFSVRCSDGEFVCDEPQPVSPGSLHIKYSPGPEITLNLPQWHAYRVKFMQAALLQ